MISQTTSVGKSWGDMLFVTTNKHSMFELRRGKTQPSDKKDVVMWKVSGDKVRQLPQGLILAEARAQSILLACVF